VCVCVDCHPITFEAMDGFSYLVCVHPTGIHHIYELLNFTQLMIRTSNRE